MSAPASSNITIVQGDLLNTTQVECIFQQCNCLAVRPHGLSEAIAKRYPYADVYSKRRAVSGRNLTRAEDRPTPGTCLILKGEGGPHVACLFGQYQSGKPGQYKMGVLTVPDTAADREHYFRDALEHFHTQQLMRKEPLRTLGFPDHIGCGLAGGDWSTYRTMLEQFATTHPEYQLTLFQL